MVITLLTDRGMRDGAAGMAKAVLLRYAADATVVDLSHCVCRDDVQQAAYLLLSAYKAFEKGTVHVIPVGVFAGARPRMLLAKKDGYFFIAPDNGILPLAFGSELENTRLCYAYTGTYSFNEWINNAGSVIAAIQEGWVLPYPKCEVTATPAMPRHEVTPYGIACSILYIDRYKNVVLDISRKQLDKIAGKRPITIKLIGMPDITTVSARYNDVPAKQPMCRFNNAGFMEISINHGHAATVLGLDELDRGSIKYQVVRLFF